MGVRRQFNGKTYKALDGSSKKRIAKKKAKKWRNKPEVKSVRVSQKGSEESGYKWNVYVNFVPKFRGYRRRKNKDVWDVPEYEDEMNKTKSYADKVSEGLGKAFGY